MSSVFLSNVDDYLAPSQACVNPLFAESVNAKENNVNDVPSKEVAVVVPRLRTIRRKRKPSDVVTVGIPSDTTETAKVSMADCLACSGCVTSAETVLVEQHSLKTLREKLATLALSSSHPTTKIVFTVSPASWADVLRHLDLPEAATSRQKLATFLNQTCRASVVLDGEVPLLWSLEEAAREFCHAYRRGRVTTTTTPPPASIALSATQSKLLQDGTIVTHTTRSESHLPLVSSSCPAVVCLIEKSHPNRVPHLATTKSPMAMAGSYFSSSEYYSNGGTEQCWHVGIMPCHDKKLEASRRDFTVNDQPDVDLVITTNEWIDLIRETCGSSDAKVMRAFVESMEPAPSIPSLDMDGGEEPSVVLVEMKSVDSSERQISSENYFFAHSSGGYADFIFRFAAKTLFGFSVEGHLPWRPIEKRGKMSARVAASRKKDYHSVALYRLSDGSYTMQRHDTDDATPVLHFATAYGFQTLQRILQPSDKNELDYDYIEAMACPSGCLNGGGQARLADRESPKETRQRVTETQRRCKVISSSNDISDMNMDVYSKMCPSGPFGPEAQLRLHTHYHVVPPLQHSLGAAAGVAVQDTQW